MHALLPEEFKAGILKEAKTFQRVAEPATAVQELDKSKPSIKLTSFEGSKGLSAQHVFIVGVHENELPKNALDIKDLEFCKFLVSLTSTRKQCHLLTAFRFSGVKMRPSIRWIPDAIKRVLKINKDSWCRKQPVQIELLIVGTLSYAFRRHSLYPTFPMKPPFFRARHYQFIRLPHLPRKGICSRTQIIFCSSKTNKQSARAVFLLSIKRIVPLVQTLSIPLVQYNSGD